MTRRRAALGQLPASMHIAGVPSRAAAEPCDGPRALCHRRRHMSSDTSSSQTPRARHGPPRIRRSIAPRLHSQDRKWRPTRSSVGVRLSKQHAAQRQRRQCSQWPSGADAITVRDDTRADGALAAHSRIYATREEDDLIAWQDRKQLDARRRRSTPRSCAPGTSSTDLMRRSCSRSRR